MQGIKKYRQQSLVKSERKLPYFPTAPFVTGRGKYAKLEDRILNGPAGSESWNGARVISSSVN